MVIFKKNSWEVYNIIVRILEKDIQMGEFEAPQVESFKSREEDPGFLVAKGRFKGSSEEKEKQEKDHRSKLSNAIFMAISNHGYATVRAIGTYAIANAVRAITVATERCRKKGISLLWESVVDKGNLGPMRSESHVRDVSAYSFKIHDWKDSEDSNEQ